MEGERPVSGPDRILSDRLKAAGHPIEPRQLERWRVDGGLVERSSNPAAFDQARDVSELLDQGLRLSEVAVVQFWRDRYVTTPALKRALHEGLVNALGTAAPARDLTQARRVAQRQAVHTIRQAARDQSTKTLRHEIKATAGRAGEKVNQAVARVIATVYMIGNFGEPPARRDLKELLTAAGLSAATLDLDAIVRQLGHTTRTDLEDALAAATREELEQAREDHTVLTRWTVEHNLLPARAPQPEHVVAVSLLVVLVLRRRLGENTMNWVIQVLESSLSPDAE